MVFLAFLDFLRVILLCFFRVPPKIFLDTILIGANGPAIALAAFAAAFALAFSAGVNTFFLFVFTHERIFVSKNKGGA